MTYTEPSTLASRLSERTEHASEQQRRSFREIREEFRRKMDTDQKRHLAKLELIRAQGLRDMQLATMDPPRVISLQPVETPEKMATKLAPWPYPVAIPCPPVAPAPTGWLRKLLPAALAALIAGGVASNASDAVNFWLTNTSPSKGEGRPLDIKPGGALPASSTFISGRLKCAENVNAMLRANGYRGTGSAMARSFLAYGKPVSGPRPGAIQVERRGGNPRAGHVQIVSHQQGGVWMCKNPSSRVGRWTMQPCANPRVLAYRMPTIADVDTSRAYASAVMPKAFADLQRQPTGSFGASILVSSFQPTEYR